MKKILALLLALAMTLALAACGGTENNTAGSGNDAAETRARLRLDRKSFVDGIYSAKGAYGNH